jgi:hypothetical protein
LNEGGGDHRASLCEPGGAPSGSLRGMPAQYGRTSLTEPMLLTGCT